MLKTVIERGNTSPTRISSEKGVMGAWGSKPSDASGAGDVAKVWVV